jgi:hypothetical protein
MEIMSSREEIENKSVRNLTKTRSIDSLRDIFAVAKIATNG